MLAERKGVKSRSKPIFGLLYRPLSSKKPSPDRNWRSHGSAGLYYCLEQCWLLMDGMSFLQTLSSLLYAPVPLALPKFPMMRSHASSSQQVKDCNCCLCCPFMFALGSFFLSETQTVEKQESNLLQNCLLLNMFYFLTLL